MGPAAKLYLRHIANSADGMTCAEIMAELGIHGSATSSKMRLKILRAAKMIYVAGWKLEPCKPPAMIFKAGDLPDVPKPEAKTDRQLTREKKQRLNELLGDSLRRKVVMAMKDKASQLVVDGVVIYRRGAGYGKTINFEGAQRLLQ